MFGKKRMSGNDKFIMSQGRKAGNLKAPLKTDKAGPLPKTKKDKLSPGRAGPMKLV